jgi:hypothetical protein
VRIWQSAIVWRCVAKSDETATVAGGSGKKQKAARPAFTDWFDASL